MIEAIENSDLCRQIQHIVGAGILENGPQKTGERVLRRLISDIRVVLLGPEVAGKSYLHAAFAAQALPQTTVSLADPSQDYQLGGADVCIWCTSEFGHDEQDQWSETPDRLKDHSFLVPMATTETAATQHGQTQLNVLQDIATEEFYGLFPIVIGDQADGAENDAVQKLIREVEKLVQMGVAADAVNAQIFLERHQPKNAPFGSINTNSPPSPQPADVDIKKEQSAVAEVYQRAHDTLRDKASKLAPLVSARSDDEFLQILAICEEASTEIADVFAEGRVGNPEFCMIKEEMLSAADKVLLMSLEGGLAPAIAATTTILQIQRELEVQIAN